MLRNKVLQALVDSDFFVSQGEALTGVLAWSDIVKMDFDASNVHQYVGSSRSSDTYLICTLLASDMELQAANLELRTMIAAGFFNVNQQYAALTASQNATRGDMQDVKDATSPTIDRYKNYQKNMLEEMEGKQAHNIPTAGNNINTELDLSSGSHPHEQIEISEILEGYHSHLCCGCELSSITPSKLDFTHPLEVCWAFKFIAKFWTQNDKVRISNPEISKVDLKSLVSQIQKNMVRSYKNLKEKKKVRKMVNIKGLVRKWDNWKRMGNSNGDNIIVIFLDDTSQ